MKSKYDVVILGAGHNGLVAAAYLAGAGLSVLMLEKNDYIGGATTSQRLFPDFDANISRYSYLVSLLPEKIIRDLGLRMELRTRATASFTPFTNDLGQQALVLSNVNKTTGRDSLRELARSDGEFQQMEKFYGLARVFAENVWDTMLEPLRSRAEFAQCFGRDKLASGGVALARRRAARLRRRAIFAERSRARLGFHRRQDRRLHSSARCVAPAKPMLPISRHRQSHRRMEGSRRRNGTNTVRIAPGRGPSRRGNPDAGTDYETPAGRRD